MAVVAVVVVADVVVDCSTVVAAPINPVSLLVLPILLLLLVLPTTAPATSTGILILRLDDNSDRLDVGDDGSGLFTTNA